MESFREHLTEVIIPGEMGDDGIYLRLKLAVAYRLVPRQILSIRVHQIHNGSRFLLIDFVFKEDPASFVIIEEKLLPEADESDLLG